MVLVGFGGLFDEVVPRRLYSEGGFIGAFLIWLVGVFCVVVQVDIVIIIGFGIVLLCVDVLDKALDVGAVVREVVAVVGVLGHLVLWLFNFERNESI